jgi:hypothetical protein
MPYDLEEFYLKEEKKHAKEREERTKKHPWDGKDEGTHGY